jgi:hypothetical protein
MYIVYEAERRSFYLTIHAKWEASCLLNHGFLSGRHILQSSENGNGTHQIQRVDAPYYAVEALNDKELLNTALIDMMNPPPVDIEQNRHFIYTGC